MNYLKDNLFLIISCVAVLIGSVLPLYLMQRITITKLFDMGNSYKYLYKVKISLKNLNDQATIIKHKLTKKRFLSYDDFKLKPLYELKYNKTIVGEQIIDLQIFERLPKGKYKLYFYIDRFPRKLKIKFRLPFDGEKIYQNLIK